MPAPRWEKRWSSMEDSVQMWASSLSRSLSLSPSLPSSLKLYVQIAVIVHVASTFITLCACTHLLHSDFLCCLPPHRTLSSVVISLPSTWRPSSGVNYPAQGSEYQRETFTLPPLLTGSFSSLGEGVRNTYTCTFHLVARSHCNLVLSLSLPPAFRWYVCSIFHC